MLKEDLSLAYYINKIFHSDIFSKSIPDKFLDDIDKKIIKLTFKDTAFSLVIYIHDNNITILDNDKDVDAELIISPIVFIMFILTKGSDKFSSKIVINGDIDTANKFNNFLSNSNKLREVTNHILGEKNAMRLEHTFIDIKSALTEFINDSNSDLVDTLIDDLNILPSEKEINKYLDDVDDLKSRTDQLYKKYKNVK
tara:strand:- start:417 stop:1007 length:591 start_codon:yes stop_codon:yes gene_type:complete